MPLRPRQRHLIGTGLLAALIWLTILLSQDYELSTILDAGRTNIFQKPKSQPYSPEYPTPPIAVGQGTANATLVFLARNSDLDGVISSMSQLERRFNSKFGYPWVFLNEVEFSEEFKTRVKQETAAPVSFGLIPQEHWYQPEWIDEDKATLSREKMVQEKIIYGGSLPYRNMCRFNSGFFFHHPLLQPYKYYWRVEPDIKYTCDILNDPFDYLRDHNKVYGFTITFMEFEKTISTLWEAVKEFINLNPQYLPADNAMKFISDDDGNTYNLCHLWSNFEIADMDFWRGEAYTKFFEFLDQKGGFYYERWGDAPVHSIAAALFVPKDQLHFFDDIGYRHEPYERCPRGELRAGRNCDCDAKNSLDYCNMNSCLGKWHNLW